MLYIVAKGHHCCGSMLGDSFPCCYIHINAVIPQWSPINKEVYALLIVSPTGTMLFDILFYLASK